MNRAGIIEKLRAFPYEKTEYRVITGSAMVLYGIRELTHDIDLECTPSMADRLEAEGYLYKKSPDGERSFKTGEDIEAFESRTRGDAVYIEDIPVIPLGELAEMKRRLGREKDKRDLKLIEEFVKRTEMIGKTVKGKIDRPAGSRHPQYNDLVYPVNYGYVEGVPGGDGEDQDVYVLGADAPLKEFEGRVIAVYHRFDDAEDKWIVALDGEDRADDEILKAIDFQEKFFKGALIRRQNVTREKIAKAYFAGGCFWCMTPVFKQYGVKDAVCGYSGGKEKDPSYEDVKSQKTGHRETIMLEYDPEKVSYEKLLDIYFASVDPFDAGGQFIDRGRSYSLAIYYTCEKERSLAAEYIERISRGSGKEVFVSLEPFTAFYTAEEYHQNYYLKHPEEFEQELVDSGRKPKTERRSGL